MSCGLFLSGSAGFEHIDPGLPEVEGLGDVPFGQAERLGIEGGKHQLVEAATEGRAHHSLADPRAEDDFHGLLDLAEARRQQYTPAPIRANREGPACPNLVIHGSGWLLRLTVRSAARSCRSVQLTLISTVALLFCRKGMTIGLPNSAQCSYSWISTRSALVEVLAVHLDTPFANDLDSPLALRVRSPWTSIRNELSGEWNTIWFLPVLSTIEISLRSVRVVQGDGMARPRTKDALDHRARLVQSMAGFERRRVAAIPEGSEHEWAMEIAVLEADQHFVADFGEAEKPTPATGHGGGDTHPGAFVIVGEPGETDPDPAEILGVPVAGDDPDCEVHSGCPRPRLLEQAPQSPCRGVRSLRSW